MHAEHPGALAPRPWLWALVLVTVVGLAWSGWQPYDRTTWWLEVLPVWIGLPWVAWVHRQRPFTSLVCVLLCAHALVLMLGGAYSYARVPLGFQLQEWFQLSRNPYDKIGHLMQGFVPALLAREILLRGQHVRGRRMLAFLCLCVVMALSACYELLEWASAVALGQGADEFLGTQGDPWDTQSDMFHALVGGSLSLWWLSRWQDRQLQRLGVRTGLASEG